MMGIGCRRKIPSTRLHEYIPNTTNSGSDSDFVDSSWYPIDDFVDSSRFSPQNQAFLAAITAERWRGAVVDDIDALDERAI